MRASRAARVMGVLSARQTMTPKKYRERMKELMVLSAGEERAFRALASKGMLPLDFMLGVMRDPTEDKAERMRMAVASAPYVHPRLASIQTTAHVTGHLTLEDLVVATLPSVATGTQQRVIEHMEEAEEAEVIDAAAMGAEIEAELSKAERELRGEIDRDLGLEEMVGGVEGGGNDDER